MSDELSRRDFLKLSGMGTLSLAFRRPIQELDKANEEIEQEKTFETEKAIYVPFFEIHTRRNTDQRVIDTKPDYFFCEFVARTEKALNYSPLKILASEGSFPGNSVFIDRPDIKTGRFFSHELLVGLDEVGTDISIEGIDVPPELVKQADIVIMSSNVLPGLTTLASLGIALGRLAKKGEFSKGDCTRIYSSVLASLWASSDELTKLGVLVNYDKDEDSSAIRNAQEVANRINATVSFAHPEDVTVFMRNIFMASKLITLGDQPSNGDDKTKIAFRMGAGHGAVSDLVKTGKTICHTMLNIYPNDILKQVIEYNTSSDKTLDERIEDFCTTIVIPVHEARMYGAGTRYVVDNELKEYLSGRFIEPQK